MKRLLFLFCFFSLIHFSAKGLDASIAYATFKSPDKSFIEVYLNVMGTTVGHKTIDSLTFQASVQVLIMIKKEEGIIGFEKYVLDGPSSKFPLDFMDVQRFALDDGNYQLEVELMDLNDSTNNVVYNGAFSIDYEKKAFQQSDLQLIRSIKASEEATAFVKNGYYMEPLPYNFYYKTDSVLIFYQELYNSNLAFDGKFLMSYIVEKEHGNGDREAVMMGHQKLDPKEVNVLLVKKSIKKLESGRYFLRVEIKDREGTLISEKESRFDRSNPYRDYEIIENTPMEEVFVASLDSLELRYSLKAIASNVDPGSVEVLNLVIKNRDVEAQRRYLYSFWSRMDKDPKKAYTRYMEVARAVDKTYKSAFGYGFETERGRIFMKYGKPSNVITVENEPSAPPYEIWFYDKVPGSRPQSDVRFLFYNPSLAGGNYQLLHSTCIGEVSNPNWEVELYRDSQTLDNLDYDATRAGGGINRRAREYFNEL